MSHIENQSVGFSIFDSGAYFSFIHKKTEKLAAAIYLITNSIKDNEPLKWSVREKSLEIVELSLIIRSASASELGAFFKEYSATADEIISLVSIARHAGLVSPMNYEILKNEFANIAKTIEETEEKHRGTASLGLDFFATENVPSNRQEDKNVQKDKNPSKTVSFIKGHTEKDKNPSAKTDISRKERILNMFKNKDGLGIKDIAVEMKEVSEKTIQRELISLVTSGVLKKEGDRRWSRYFLQN